VEAVEKFEERTGKMKIYGKNNRYAVVHTDEIDQSSYDQIRDLVSHPAFEDEKIIIMPDVHAGKGSVIGFTSTFSEKVIPSVIGVDIGCGVLSCRIESGKPDFEKLHEHILQNIPHGFQVHKTEQSVNKDYDKLFRETARKTNQDENYVMRSLGTLGGGNHFIEVNYNEEKDEYWLTVHTGSRKFGLMICAFYSEKANENIQHHLPWLEGELAAEYLKDMRIAQEFASYNRRLISLSILGHLGCKMTRFIESVHNFIEYDRIIRKGAVSALSGQEVVIPWNMAEGLIFGKGKGNPEWNNSAPHGSGRKLSRSAAKKELTIEEFENSMKGVWSKSISQKTIDEAPMAYKETSSVKRYLSETVEITDTLPAVFNFKA